MSIFEVLKGRLLFYIKMDRIILQRATAHDARFIAENVLRALHIDEADDEHIEYLATICCSEDTLYSWRNATIALYDGVPAGLMIAYDGARGTKSKALVEVLCVVVFADTRNRKNLVFI